MSSTSSTGCTSTRWRTTSTSSRRVWTFAPAVLMKRNSSPRIRRSTRCSPSSNAFPRSPRASPPRSSGTSPPVCSSATSSSWRRSSPWVCCGSKVSSTLSCLIGSSERLGRKVWITRYPSGSARRTGRWSTPFASLSSTRRSGMTSWVPRNDGASGWSWSAPRRNQCRATGKRWSSSSNYSCSAPYDPTECPTPSARSSRTR
mmetsp:Transcript_6462/g.17381  ORF Transcript_6462/g.17381 Transcript_6462/m.17381 type:complete len:202 (+) Transcript_6462:1514-2119(+)